MLAAPNIVPTSFNDLDVEEIALGRFPRFRLARISHQHRRERAVSARVADGGEKSRRALHSLFPLDTAADARLLRGVDRFSSQQRVERRPEVFAAHRHVIARTRIVELTVVHEL